MKKASKQTSKQAHKKLVAECEAAERALDKAERRYANAATDKNYYAAKAALMKCDRLWDKVDQDWRRWVFR